MSDLLDRLESVRLADRRWTGSFPAHDDGPRPTTRRRVMDAETIAKALGGRKAGDDWVTRCPAHDDRKPSLAIRDADNGKGLVCCHAGCEQERVIASLQARGLWKRNGWRPLCRPAFRGNVERRTDQDNAKRSEGALATRQSAMPAQATLVGTYLASRGIDLSPPNTLHFHIGLKHPPGSTSKYKEEFRQTSLVKEQES